MRVWTLGRTSLFLLIAFYAEGIGIGPSERCRLLELERMHGANEFTCRVEQWKGIENLNLRVTIRDLPVPEDPSHAHQLQNSIINYIRNSKKVILDNIRPRNYFRVIADVKIGRDNLLDLLRKEGLYPAELETPKTQQSPEPLQKSYCTLPSDRAPAGKSPIEKARSYYTPESLQRAMETEVDLSGLDAAGTLRETLEQIRLAFDPPLPLVVLWNDLQKNLFIDPETPIGVGGLTTIPVQLALELVFSSVSPGPDKPVVVQKDNILLVVSRSYAVRQMTTRVYNIHELSAIPVFINDYVGGKEDFSAHSRGLGR